MKSGVRSRSSFVRWGAILPLLAAGCLASTSPTPSAAPSAQPRPELSCERQGAERIETASYRGGGKPDVLKVFHKNIDGNPPLYMSCKEVDLNGDGRKDMLLYLDKYGRKLREEFDHDKDGGGRSEVALRSRCDGARRARQLEGGDPAGGHQGRVSMDAPAPLADAPGARPMLAALQAPVIMMSQNRHAERDREAAEHDYQVNLKAELEIMALHDKLDQLRVEQLEKILDAQSRQIALLQQLLESR